MAELKERGGKCLHCCFHYLAAVILWALHLWNESEGWTRKEYDVGRVGGLEAEGQGKEELEEEERGKKAVKLIFCAEPYTATDMLRQKPGPGEAAWVWLMNKVKVSEVYYVN